MQEKCQRLTSQREMDDLLDLNRRNQDEIISNYPYHKDWIKKAVRDIRNGSRVAFGVYEGSRLIGSVIVKHGLSSDLELKNFLIEKSNGDVFAVRDKLLNHVENFGQRNDYDICSIDIVTKEIEELNYFLNHGFTISYLKQYPKKETLNLYSLTKELDQVYNDDPLSFKSKVEWILNFKYGFNSVNGGINQLMTDFAFASFYKYNFEISNTNISKNYIINGEALICDIIDERKFNKEKLSKDFINNKFSEDVTLKTFFHSSKNKKITDNKWMTFNIDDVNKLLETNSNSKVPFSANDVGGCIYYLDDFSKRLFFSSTPKLFDARGHKYIMFLNEAFLEEVSIGDDLFFCDLDQTNKLILKAKSKILSIHDYTLDIVQKIILGKDIPNDIKDYLESFLNPYKRKEDWNYVSSFMKSNNKKNESNHKIWMLCLDKIINPTIKEPQKISVLDNLNSSTADYIKKEVEDSFLTTSYIDVKSVQKLNDFYFNDLDDESTEPIITK